MVQLATENFVKTEIQLAKAEIKQELSELNAKIDKTTSGLTNKIDKTALEPKNDMATFETRLLKSQGKLTASTIGAIVTLIPIIQPIIQKLG